jgi:hypothetical protein
VSRRRSIVRLAAGLALLAALVTWGAWGIFVRHVYEPPEHLAPAPVAPSAAAIPLEPEPKDPEGAAVLAVQGRVERTGAPGAWIPLQAGDLLRPDESLRTGPAASAELSVGERSHITVAEATELTVREVTRAAHRFRLTRGRITADYQPDGERVLRVEGESGQATVEARAARFHIASAGVTLAVATETGRVNLKTSSGQVDVGAGEQASARAGAAPTTPSPIAAQVLLRLASAGRAQADPCAVVEGRVTPGTQVEIDGEAAEVDAAGRFALRTRRRSRAAVRVVAVDPSGRRAEHQVACRDEWHPVSDLEVRWGHGKRP